MKKLLLLLVTVLCFFSCSAKQEKIEISFNYTSQAGPGSNQYAVWIEDADCHVVKTLFVTHFSVLGRSRNGEPAERGYRYREPCVSRWIKNVNADSLSDAELDAVSGATPKGGLQSFTWDFTDQNGQTVPAGEYTVYIQANLHDWTVKTFACKLPKNVKSGVQEFTEDYQNADAKYEGMITDVKFEVK